ncbi:MAG: M20 aminoacylase family protein [Nitratireductor sp.]
MAVINRMAELHDEITIWRRDIHSNPELGYDVHETAASVAEKLRAFGCDEVVEGLGKTGVVGVIKGGENSTNFVIGLRADMDALPIEEITKKSYASKNEGKMHACGHDGHTAMLLGAAKYLTETRNFNGTCVVIFQPAEEGGGGGRAMVEDGLMEKFAIDEVYGMHNLPGLDVGDFAIKSGAIMASTDEVLISVTGKGAHAAMPHLGVDPIVAGSQLVVALQTIVSRNLNPLESLVVSVTKFHGGTAGNIIPEDVKLSATVRSLSPDVRKYAEDRIKEICEGVAKATGTQIDVAYKNNYPVTVNHKEQTQKAIRIASLISGEARVDAEVDAMMGAEDFSYMLEARPGAFIFVGNGDTAGLHHPAYDFNDDAIPVGCSYWAKLIETLMPNKLS